MQRRYVIEPEQTSPPTNPVRYLEVVFVDALLRAAQRRADEADLQAWYMVTMLVRVIRRRYPEPTAQG